MPDLVPRRWTLSEVRALIHFNPVYTPRYELVDGDVLVTLMPTPAHQRALGDLLLALASWLRGKSRIGETLASPFNVELEPESLVWPDVFVMPAHAATQARCQDHTSALILAVEILSPSSEHGDRGPKRRLYQRHVPEYWIVDLEAALVERWRPGDAEPEIIRERLEWNPVGAPDPLVIDLRELFERCGAPTRRSDDVRREVVRLDIVPPGTTSDDPRIFTPVAIENPLRPGERQLLPLVRVDPDSPSSWIPTPVLEALGIEGRGVRYFERADGTVLKRSIGLASVHVAGIRTSDDVVFAEAGDAIVLGARSLAGLNLWVDPVMRQLEDVGPRPAAVAFH
jgi:Uma2 family endonuclease